MRKSTCLLFTVAAMLLFYYADSQTSAANNKVSESVTFSEPPKSASIYGIFEGRTPCHAVTRQLNADLPADCDHLKWQLILYQDPVTRRPVSYQLMTEMFRLKPVTGKWRISTGTKTDPQASVYVLESVVADKPLYLLKGDENVLFILDENHGFRTGDANFSYTLDRVNKVRRSPNSR
jgi:hypothetical protein